MLRTSVAQGLLLLTHDSDFGALAIVQREPVVGLVFLRPGHIDPQFTIGTLQTLLAMDPDLSTPFILVAKRASDIVTLRIRQLGTP